MKNEFMQLAVEEAKKGFGFTSPNPVVGAVLVKNKKVIASGFHKKAGRDHAEVVAIKKIKDKKLFRGSELYVTLEPCSHFGKTPPCADLIVKSGIKKVYIGMKDPSKKVNGGGIKHLRKNGVQVEMCRDKKLVQDIRLLNQSFIKTRIVSLPYVILKAGISLDGKIATKIGDSKWITNPEARKDARLERSQCDAVLVGAGTVKSDNPELAPQDKYKHKKLLRIVLDADLSTSTKAKVYRDKNIFVACTDLAPQIKRKRFSKAEIEFKSFGRKKINIKKLLEFLSRKEIQKIFVEGGSEVHGSFTDVHKKNNNIIDQIIFYVAPKIIGGRDAKTVVGGEGVDLISNSLVVKSLDYNQINDNIKISGFVNKY